MASGTINLTSTIGTLAGRINWRSTSNGSEANNSNVYAELQIHRTDNYTTTGTWTGSLTIDGTTQNFSIHQGVSSGWFTVKSFTKYNIGHNSDGSKTINISGICNGPTGTSMAGKNVSGNANVTLDKIARYITSWNLVATPGLNSIDIKWSTKEKCSKIKYGINANNLTEKTVNSTGGTFTITGLNPNTSYTVYMNFQRADSKLYLTDNKTVTTKTYDIYKLVNVPNVNIGSNTSITINGNCPNATVSIKLCDTNNNLIKDYGNIDNPSNTKQVGLIFSAIANTIYAKTPNSNTYKARIILTTSANGKSYTDSKDFNFYVTNSNPTFSNFTYAEDSNNTKILELTGNNQILVKGYSKIIATISSANKAIAKNSATMKTYNFIVGNKSAVINYADTVQLTIDKPLVNVLTMYAKDSRGNSTAVTKNLSSNNFKQYTTPVINTMTLERGNNGVGKQVTLTYNGTFWNQSFGAKTNAILSVTYSYKKTTANTYSAEKTITPTISGNKFSGSLSIQGDLGADGFNITDAYNIRITVKDRLSTITNSEILNKGTVALAIYEDCVSIGEQYDETLGKKFQVHGEIIANNPNNGESFITAIRKSNNVAVSFGVGENGINHGLYSRTLKKWMVYGDESNIYLNGTAEVANAINIGNRNTTDTWIPVIKDGKLGYTLRHIATSLTSSLYNTAQDRLATLSTLSFWNGAYSTNNYSNLIYCRDGMIQSKPKILYNNASGSNGTITLSDSSSNYDYLEIYFSKDYQTSYNFVKIFEPNGKEASLMTGYADPTKEAQLQIGTIYINGASITWKMCGYINLYLDGSIHRGNATELKIHKVVGYK